jgi:hypothetical protein
MVFYVLAALGGLTVLVLGLILVFVLLAWFSEPVPYSVPGHDLQRFFSSWGIALGDRGKIIVRQAKTDRSIQFVKRDYKNRADRLVLRCRNADETRKYFESVKTALEATGNDVKIELTPRGKPRAALLEFNVEDPLMPSAAAHAARVALSAMGAPVEGPFELYCQGSHRADYQPGSVEVIPWTRGYRAGFRLGRLAARVLGRD